MSIHSLTDVYHHQIQDIYSACKQSRDITLELADVATDSELKAALKDGADGIAEGMRTAEAIAQKHEIAVDQAHCKAMEGLAAEARAHVLAQDFHDDAARDAMIITQYQRMTHYGIAGWGSLAAFAERLGHSSDGVALRKALDNTYDGDRRMTDIAGGGVNKDAA